LGYEYARIAAPIPLDTFERYGRWFQERLVPGVRENRVKSVQQTGAGFEIRLDTGDTLRSRSVVMATGMTGYIQLPRALQDLPAKAVVHTYDQRDPGQSRGTEVAVIGAGQSALESAALMHEQGAKVRVIARASKVAWNSRPGGRGRPLRARWRYPESGLGEGRSQWLYSNYPLLFHAAGEARRRRHAYRALGPAGAWWLRARIEGHIEPLLGRTVAGAVLEDEGVRLRLQGPTRAQEELHVARVIAGTGYRADVSQLSLLDSSLRDGIATATNIPVLDRAFQSSVPGLYFVGYSAGLSFGPVMRFVYGADFAARRLARALAQ
jgi:cation diffusion facilitator CzcD-associated flavoprotein CzcO